MTILKDQRKVPDRKIKKRDETSETAATVKLEKKTDVKREEHNTILMNTAWRLKWIGQHEPP